MDTLYKLILLAPVNVVLESAVYIPIPHVGESFCGVDGEHTVTAVSHSIIRDEDRGLVVFEAVIAFEA